MKRISIFLAAVLTFAACQKNETPSPSNEGATIYATIEEVASTKTYMDANNNIRWSENDQVAAFMRSSVGVKYQVAEESVGKTSALFIKKANGSIGCFWTGTYYQSNNDDAYSLTTRKDYSFIDDSPRYLGRSVRPVKDK